jgi:ribonuclease III
LLRRRNASKLYRVCAGRCASDSVQERLRMSDTRVETDLNELEAVLGYSFERPALLECALTHRSLANERAHEIAIEASAAPATARDDNERLEFLGDAVLSLVVAEALFALHPDWREGELTRVRSLLVSREHMAQVAGQLGLGKYVRLSRGEERSGLRNKKTVLSNTMEAVMGALFLDGGLDPVRAFVTRLVMGKDAERFALELRSGEALGNYKSALQERLQALHAGAPVYRVKNESGPDHHKRFLVEVRLKGEAGQPGKSLARGMGRTKKHAEQDAARRALERLLAAGLSNTDEDASGLDPDQEEEASL